ncbi:hypothetical protein CDAR_112861 [Caerostris darwini]|uniref:Maturase K n=1 Tax=Caerostris darwini TaxID=1538125 RepID=A0AAV4Q2R8_9ARAC|nr:hypothetical protein CDAR_112861 [Caerostris darwini]
MNKKGSHVFQKGSRGKAFFPGIRRYDMSSWMDMKVSHVRDRMFSKRNQEGSYVFQDESERMTYLLLFSLQQSNLPRTDYCHIFATNKSRLSIPPPSLCPSNPLSVSSLIDGRHEPEPSKSSNHGTSNDLHNFPLLLTHSTLIIARVRLEAYRGFELQRLLVVFARLFSSRLIRSFEHVLFLFFFADDFGFSFGVENYYLLTLLDAGNYKNLEVDIFWSRYVRSKCAIRGSISPLLVLIMNRLVRFSFFSLLLVQTMASSTPQGELPLNCEDTEQVSLCFL